MSPRPVRRQQQNHGSVRRYKRPATVTDRLREDILGVVKGAEAAAPEKPADLAKPYPWLTQDLLDRLGRTGTPGVHRARMVEPFKPYQPLQGVLPEKAAKPVFAMDDALQGEFATSWAANNPAWSAFAEGQGFMGYAYLSELLQRAEYRRMSERTATEMTRKWIRLVVSGDDEDKKKKTELEDKIKELNEDLAKFQVRDVFQQWIYQGEAFGRSHLYIDTGDTDRLDELQTSIGDGRSDESKKFKKDSLVAFRTVEPIWCYPAFYNANNPLKADWYNPQQWYALGTQIHVSRLLCYVPHEVPDILKPAYAFGGLSLTQMAKPYIDNWLRTRQAVTDLVESFSVNGIYTNMAATNQVGGLDMIARIDAFNLGRSNRGTMVLDKETEEYFNIATPLSSLDQLQAQAQEQMSSICGIPLIVLLGISPHGLNASSEGELRAFYDFVHAMQESKVRPKLKVVLDFLQLNRYGKVAEEINFEFEPLWSLDEKGEAEVNKIKAETYTALADLGAVDQEEIRHAVVADPGLPFNGLDPDDVPEIDDSEEEAALIGGGGGAGGSGGRTSASTRSDNNEVSGAADDGIDFSRLLAQDDFREEDHPRGQPGNAGQFGPGGGGTKKEQKPEKKKGARQMGERSSSSAKQMGEKAKPSQMGEGEKTAKQADATKLYKSPARSPEQTAELANKITAQFKGGAEAIAKTRERLSKVIPTDAWVEDGGYRVKAAGEPGYTYTPERQKVHQAIVESFFTPETVRKALPKEGEKPRVIMLGGRGGSGKSWITSKGPLAGDGAIVLDADHIKTQLPGYEGWNASSLHEESSDVLKLVDQQARKLGVSVVLDATLKSEATSATRLAEFEGEGYEAEGYYMYCPPEIAATRAMARYAKGGKFDGRFVPPEVILGNVNNEKNFDKLSKGFKKWAVYDNSEEGGGPKLVSRSGDD